jgi:hypothetical protein
MIYPTAGPNDAVADLDSLALAVASLYDKGDLLNALEFCSLAEAVVLQDRVIIVDCLDEVDDDESKNRHLMKQFLAPWQGASAITYSTLPERSSDTSPESVREEPVRDVERSEVMVANVESGDPLAIASREARNLADAERSFLCPGLALPRQSSVFEASSHVREDHSVCSLSAKYSSLREALEELRQRSRMPWYKYMSLPIPPIALQIYDKAKNVEDLVKTTLEAREQYQPIRARLYELREILNDEGVDLARKDKLLRSWRRTWRTLDALSGDLSVIEMAKTSTKILREDKIFESISFNDLAWLKIVERLLPWIEERFHIWKIRALHRTASHYKGASDAQLNAAVSSVLKREIGQEEIADTVEIFAMLKALSLSMNVRLHVRA